MNEIYSEKISTFYFITITLAITCLILFFVIIAPFLGKQLFINNNIKIVIAIILVFDLIVLFSFRTLNILLTEEKLIFGFGRFRKKLNFSEIEKVELGEYKFSNYFGYGIRFGRDKTVGYVPRGGRGLKIFVRKQPTYFIITERAEELKSLLEKQLSLVDARRG
ncbi:hypothetical protein KKC32_05210 [Patescibacteria group bacterium]|nr:hypothetical protein [Patescibacteria group bacterium]